MARLLHHGSREGVELIQADAQEQERPGDAIADLRAAGKRLGDLDLTAIIRRVRWQFDRHVQRSAAAEAQAARSAAQVDVLTRQRDLIGRQRDEAVAQVRQLQRSGPDARLERLSAEFKRAMAERTMPYASATRCARFWNGCGKRWPTAQAPRILLHRLCSARQGPSRGSRFR
jgi:hypothetical protein